MICQCAYELGKLPPRVVKLRSCLFGVRQEIGLAADVEDPADNVAPAALVEPRVHIGPGHANGLPTLDHTDQFAQQVGRTGNSAQPPQTRSRKPTPTCLE